VICSPLAIIDFASRENYRRTVMRYLSRQLVWILASLGLLGMILQSLQVQVEHTHSAGNVDHSHSHGNNHSHGHGHSHSHSHSHSHGRNHSHSHQGHAHSPQSAASGIPQTHIHVSLLWWEFTLNVDSAQSQPATVVTSLEQPGDEPSEPRIHGHQTRRSTGPLFTSVSWGQILAELYAGWNSVLPPDKNRMPAQQGLFSLLSLTACCYEWLAEAPPVPPPETPLSVSFT